jgi:hypothetical protein
MPHHAHFPMFHHMPSNLEGIGVEWKTWPSFSGVFTTLTARLRRVVIAAATPSLIFLLHFIPPSSGVPNQIEIIGEVRVNGKPPSNFITSVSS